MRVVSDESASVCLHSRPSRVLGEKNLISRDHIEHNGSVKARSAVFLPSGPPQSYKQSDNHQL